CLDHHASGDVAPPERCPRCSGSYIYFLGVGTEQLEEILRGRFPTARIARVDRDTTRRRGALKKILVDFSERRLDILVGTQILAKGHDFPDVTLVGVVAADAGLSFPDFRAAERTFQLLTQVAGRAGRGHIPGRVVIQAYYPDHYALAFARRQDYFGFYAREIEFRKLLGYPPFCDLVQIIVSGPADKKARTTADRLAAELRTICREQGSGARTLGPSPAPLEKIRGAYRFQILIKSAPGTDRTGILREAFQRLAKRKLALKSVQVDVDPLSLM
ncbi:MAG: primosomal protein N', partial [Acidobacteriota bacterium]